MTKRMIDADALLKWATDEYNHNYIECNPLVYVFFLIDKIDELATPAHKSQQATPNFNELLKWIEAQEQFEGRTSIDIQDLKEVVSEITAPQESIFDAEGWCKDFEISQEYNKILVVTFLNDIIIASPQSKNSTWQKWQPLPSV